MLTSPLLRESLRRFLDSALSKMESTYKDDEITDFYIRLDSSCRQLSLMDDNDLELSSLSLPMPSTSSTDSDSDDIDSDDYPDDESYVESSDPDSILQSLRPYLQEALTDMNRRNAFSNVSVFRPFSFVLGDDEMMEDLLVVDDTSLILGDDLLKELDEDLDSFIDRLLSQ